MPDTAVSLNADEIAAGAYERREKLIATVAVDFPRVPSNVLEDLFQEALEYIHARTDIADACHLEGAMHVALRYRALHYLESSRRREAETDPQVLAERYDSPSDEDPAERAEHKLAMAHVEDFLSELSDREQAVVRLFWGESLSRIAVGRRLGIPVVVARRDLYRVEQRLAQFATLLTAGRVCDKREPMIAAYHTGNASPDELRQATAHLEACVPCRIGAAGLREQLRAAAAAVIPLPALIDSLGFGQRLGHTLGGLRAQLMDLGHRVFSPGWRAAGAAGSGGAVAGISHGALIVGGACVTAAVCVGGGAALLTDQGASSPRHRHAQRVFYSTLARPRPVTPAAARHVAAPAAARRSRSAAAARRRVGRRRQRVARRRRRNRLYRRARARGAPRRPLPAAVVGGRHGGSPRKSSSASGRRPRGGGGVAPGDPQPNSTIP